MGLMWFQLVLHSQSFSTEDLHNCILHFHIAMHLIQWILNSSESIVSKYLKLRCLRNSNQRCVAQIALIGNEFGTCPTNLSHCDDMWTNAVNFNPNWINIISINFNNSQTQSQSKHWWGSINSELFGALGFWGLVIQRMRFSITYCGSNAIP